MAMSAVDALRIVLAGVISGGSGPAAPVFDEFDAAVESERGHWYKVAGASVDRAREVLAEIDADGRGAEPPDEQVVRVRLMASGGGDWDLSPNDRAAILAVLRMAGVAPSA